MPLGACTPLVIFQWMIDNICQELLDNEVIVYLNYIFIYTKNVDKHVLRV